jgi:hypothetical protein
VDGLVRPIPLRKVAPLRTRPQNPEDTVQNLPAIRPRPPRRAGVVAWNKRFKNCPLRIGQVHARSLTSSSDEYKGVLRWLLGPRTFYGRRSGAAGAIALDNDAGRGVVEGSVNPDHTRIGRKSGRGLCEDAHSTAPRIN